jgi:hypothetical protein
MNNDINKSINESYVKMHNIEIMNSLLENIEVDSVIKEAMENCILTEDNFYNAFRPYSDKYFEVFRIMREMQHYSCELEKVLVEETDIGEMGEYEGEQVPLDIPMQESEEEESDDTIEEAEYKGKEVELNKPKRGGSKKYYVYVKNDKGNVIKVSFGDTSGLSAKISDKEARKSFVTRHKCNQAKDKTKAGYWSCRLPRYAKELGLSGGGNFFW